VCASLLVPIGGYASSYRTYCKDIRYGKEALKSGDYSNAGKKFEEAYQNGKSRDALMYLAIIDYRTNNVDNAERLIREAELMGGFNYHYLRVLGYKALILLKKNKDQGLEALDRMLFFIPVSTLLCP
jgi:Flp pilus assembly protein TadD